MSNLSVFIDESGDAGTNSGRYLVTLVFHEQSRSIDAELVKLSGRLRNLGFPLDAAIHSGPIIRRKDMYANMTVAERKKVFSTLFNFCMAVRVTHKTFTYLKRELGARTPAEIEARLQARIARDIKLFIGEHVDYFTSFDRVIAYYDNGQHIVGAAVREAFLASLSRVEFRRVQPSGYRLFQAADLICTLELLRAKDAAGELSRSELAFFGSPGRLRKNYLRHIARLHLA